MKINKKDISGETYQRKKYIENEKKRAEELIHSNLKISESDIRTRALEIYLLKMSSTSRKGHLCLRGGGACQYETFTILKCQHVLKSVHMMKRTRIHFTYILLLVLASISAPSFGQEANPYFSEWDSLRFIRKQAAGNDAI